jgi:hypothetical protein
MYDPQAYKDAKQNSGYTTSSHTCLWRKATRALEARRPPFGSLPRISARFFGHLSFGQCCTPVRSQRLRRDHDCPPVSSSILREANSRHTELSKSRVQGHYGRAGFSHTRNLRKEGSVTTVTQLSVQSARRNRSNDHQLPILSRRLRLFPFLCCLWLVRVIAMPPLAC